MATIAVCDVFEDKWAFFFDGVLLAVLDGGFDCEDVHGVDLQAGDVLAALVVFCESGRASGRCTHAVFVVLASKEDRQVPQLGHVECFEDLALVGCAVAVEREGGCLAASILVSEGDASTDGDLSANDAVAAVEACGEHVHGASFTVGDTFAAAEQFTDDGLYGSTAHVGEAVAAVGGDDGVVFGEGMLDAD